jgi:hypothetical protein
MMIQRQEALSSTRHLGVDMNNIFKMLAISAVLVAFSACNSLEQVAPTEETQQVTPVEDTQTDTDLAKMSEVGAEQPPSGAHTSRFRILGYLGTDKFYGACVEQFGRRMPTAPTFRGPFATGWYCMSRMNAALLGRVNFGLACRMYYGSGAKAYFRNRHSSISTNWYCWR